MAVSTVASPPWLFTFLVVVAARLSLADPPPNPCPSDDTSKENAPAMVFKKEEFPNPSLELEKCGRSGTDFTYICDPANIMAKDEADQLDLLLDHVRMNTSCVCKKCLENTGGFHISVALVEDIQGEKEEPTEYDKLKELERFARYLRTISWKYGRCDDDAVIIVSTTYKKAWTSMGDTMSEHLSDWCVNEIYKEYNGLLWTGNLTLGLTKMIGKYGEVLGGRMECEEGLRVGTVIFALAMFLFIGCFVISVGSFFKRRFRLCEGK